MDRVVIDRRVLGGVPCIEGTRIPVATVLGLLGEGIPVVELPEHHPQLTGQDILACTRYDPDVVQQRTVLCGRAYVDRGTAPR